ncbi:hypothetical protein CLH_0339 [Clostridium botulinum E3 str. Alaska E43]|nr:hypothetical protein CLH_0339 [Clostridium botulinum E3 str. Alaska E43]
MEIIDKLLKVKLNVDSSKINFYDIITSYETIVNFDIYNIN